MLFYGNIFFFFAVLHLKKPPLVIQIKQKYQKQINLQFLKQNRKGLK